MTRVLLDTTALPVHYLDESGVDQVHHVLEDTDTELFMCAVSVTEFARRLVTLGETPAAARERALDYAGLCDSVVPVDTAVSVRAFELASAAPSRIPLVDALIAAAAHLSEASLVHRDARFRTLTAIQQREIGTGASSD